MSPYRGRTEKQGSLKYKGRSADKAELLSEFKVCVPADERGPAVIMPSG